MEKEFKQLELTDNFMFCKVLGNNPDLCRHYLELILGEPIRKVEMQTYERVIDLTSDGKSIRMDVYLDDDAGTVYDLEMQTTRKRNLPKRVRYYQGIIDLNQIDKGKDYDLLPKAVIIFVCTFDYYGAGIPIYTFENRCREKTELVMGDDTKKVFVNLAGTLEELPEETRKLFTYMYTHNPEDEFTNRLDQEVRLARDNQQWEVEYMNLRAFEMDIRIDKRIAREEGWNEGHEEGIAAGRAEGRAEGIAAGRAEGRAEGIAAGRAEGRAEGRTEGKAEGLSEGLEIGRIREIIQSVEEGDYSIERGAQKLGISVEEFRKRMDTRS